MKHFSVLITAEAKRDIEDLYHFISEKDSINNANYVYDQLKQLVLSLDEMPERGHYPAELEIQGIKEYRELIFKPYRIIYEINDTKVIIHLCIDGRRDMVSLLERRLLR